MQWFWGDGQEMEGWDREREDEEKRKRERTEEKVAERQEGREGVRTDETSRQEPK